MFNLKIRYPIQIRQNLITARAQSFAGQCLCFPWVIIILNKILYSLAVCILLLAFQPRAIGLNLSYSFHYLSFQNLHFIL